MGDLSFGNTVGMLKDALAGAAQTHSVIANNIANVNTPNFKRSDVSFKEALAALDAPATSGESGRDLTVDADGTVGDLGMTVTERGHIAPGSAPMTFTPKVAVDPNQTMRNDGSNVDIDAEMAKMSLNSAYAQTMGQLLSTQYTRIRQSIQEHA
jgi:flagellar basal-body rod protein FlgB